MGNVRRSGVWSHRENSGTLGHGSSMNVVTVDMCVYGKFVTLEEMVPQADFLTIHVPLTPHTRHMVSAKEFDMMKDGVMLIDCSRGGVVDEEATLQCANVWKSERSRPRRFRRRTSKKQQIVEAKERDCHTPYRSPDS